MAGIFKKGEYNEAPLDRVPTWYLQRVIGGTMDEVKFEELTPEQVVAIQDEIAFRTAPPAPPPELETQPAPTGEGTPTDTTDTPSTPVVEEKTEEDPA